MPEGMSRWARPDCLRGDTVLGPQSVVSRRGSFRKKQEAWGGLPAIPLPFDHHGTPPGGGPSPSRTTGRMVGREYVAIRCEAQLTHSQWADSFEGE